MQQKRYHPTRRKPQERDARKVSRPSAQPQQRTAPDHYRAPNRGNHTTLLDCAAIIAVAVMVVACVFACGISYQVGYQVGLEWAAS